MNLHIEKITNLINEIYINKTDDLKLQKELLKELSIYIGNTYYNLSVPILFNTKPIKNKKILGHYLQNRKIVYFLNNLQFYFHDINSLFRLIFVVSHEFGHAYNDVKRRKVLEFLDKYEDLNNLILARNLDDNFEEPDYIFYMNFKEFYLDIYSDDKRSYYKNNVDCCNEENLASLNGIQITEDMLRLICPSIYEKIEVDIKLEAFKYINGLENFKRYDLSSDNQKNVDLMFNNSEALKHAIYDNNKLIKREYNNNCKRKQTSQLLLEVYKIIMLLGFKKLRFKKIDILEKRKRFYIELMIKRDMTFPERLDDIENLINYHNVFYNIEWLKNLIISWIYQDKINTESGYSEEEVEILRKLIMNYLKDYENGSRKNK